MAKRGYLVVSQSYEYNDEYYYPSEGVDPEKVYMDKRQAEAFAKKKTKEKFNEVNPILYAQNGWEDLSSKDADEVEEELRSLFKCELRGADTWEWHSVVETGNLNPKELDRLIELFDLLQFYSVREIEVNDV